MTTLRAAFTGGWEILLMGIALAAFLRRGRFDVVWDNEAALDSIYNGTDVTLQKRLSDG